MFFLETLVIDHIGDGSPSAVAKVLIKAMGFWDYFWGKVCNARKGGMIWSKPEILSQNCLCHSPERRQECCAKAVSWKLLGDQNYFSLSKPTDNFVSALSSLQGRLFVSCASMLHSYVHLWVLLHAICFWFIQQRRNRRPLLIADPYFYKILNLVIVKQCTNLLLCNA